MCRRCHASALPVRVTPNGAWSNPPGWAHVTVAAVPVLNVTLCPVHAAELHTHLATPAVQAQADRDAAEEAAFARGYDAGLADIRDGTPDQTPRLQVVK